MLQTYEGKILEGDPQFSCLIESSTGSGPDRHVYRYRTEKVVGQGSFGTVFQAKCLETGETVLSLTLRTEISLRGHSLLYEISNAV